MNFLEGLQQTVMARWVLESDYGFYILLAGHAVGMAVVAGAMFMLAIRVLGYGKDEPMAVFDRLYPVAWWGFALNALTGTILFAANGIHLFQNLAFVLKLVMIALGGVAVFALARGVRQDQAFFEGRASASLRSKVLAVATLGLWTGAIIAGRVIGYTMTYS